MIEVKDVALQISASIQRVLCILKLIRKAQGLALGTFLFFLLASLPMAALESVSALSEAPSIVASGQAGEVPVSQNQDHSSDVLSYWYGPDYRTPFVLVPNTDKAADIGRNSIEYTHIGSWGMLSNFADVMVNVSDMTEPANNGASGATEAYVILRPGIGLNELTRSSTFKKGPLRNVRFEFGANLETKNSAYAPSEKTIYIGPKFELAMPKGFFNVGVHFRKEWNHEGVLGKSENYDPNFNLEPTWLLPFRIGKAHLAFSGFADYNSPKGKDSFGTESVSEFLVRSVLEVDIGAFLFRKSQMLDLSGGLWYWHNEYGKPSSAPGAEQLTPLVGINFHLDGAKARHNP